MSDGRGVGSDHHAPTIAGLEVTLGELMMRCGQVEEAVSCFERALSGGASLSDESRACLSLGMIRIARRDQQGAEGYWKRSISMNDGEYAPRSATLLAQLLVQQRRLAEARTICRFALESGQADAAASAALMITSIGIATDEKEFETIRGYVQQMLASHEPDIRGRAAFATGMQLWQQRRYAEAEAILLRCMAESKDRLREWARHILSVTYYEMRRYEEAIQILQTCVRSFVGIETDVVAVSVCYLASALIETGRVQEATDLWLEYSDHPDTMIANRVRGLRQGTARRLALSNLTRDHWRVTYSRTREVRADGTHSLVYGGVIKLSLDGRTWTPFHRCDHNHHTVAAARRCGTDWLNGWMADLAQERDGILRAVSAAPSRN